MDADDEIMVLGMSQYLKSEDWVQMLRSWLDAHGKDFTDAVGGEYTTAHYDLYQEFCKIADECLDSVLAILGCDAERFASIIERYLQQPLRGPTDAALKEVVKTLLALDDFESFVKLMADRAEDQGLVGPEHRECTREEKEGDDGASKSSESKAVEDVSGERRSSLKMPLGFCPQEQWDTLGDYDISDEGWRTQLTTAEDVLESYTARELEAQDEIFVPWAQAVIDFTEGVKGKVDNERLAHLITRLLRERFRVDVLVAHRTTAQRRDEVMSGLPAAGGDGADVAFLIEEHDKLRDDIKEARSAAFKWVGNDLKDEHIERLYLLLRERAWQGERDVAPICDFMFDYLCDHVPFSQHGVALAVAEWLALEDLLALLARMLQARLDGRVEEEEEEPHVAAPASVSSAPQDEPSAAPVVVAPVTPAVIKKSTSYSINILGRSGALYGKGGRASEATADSKDAKQQQPPQQQSQQSQSGEREDDTSTAAPTSSQPPAAAEEKTSSTSAFLRPPPISIPAGQARQATVHEVAGTQQIMDKLLTNDKNAGWAERLILSPNAVRFLQARTPAVRTRRAKAAEAV